MSRFLSLFPSYRRLLIEREELRAKVSRLSADIDGMEARADEIEDARAFLELERVGWQNVRNADRAWYEAEILSWKDTMADMIGREFFTEDVKAQTLADLSREAEAALDRTPPAPAVILQFRRKESR